MLLVWHLFVMQQLLSNTEKYECVFAIYTHFKTLRCRFFMDSPSVDIAVSAYIGTPNVLVLVQQANGADTSFGCAPRNRIITHKYTDLCVSKKMKDSGY